MIRINLLKPETKEVKETAVLPGAPEVKTRKPPNVGSLFFLLLVVAVGAVYFFQRRAFDKENELMATAQQEKSKLAYVTAKLEELSRQKATLVRKITLINELKSRQDLAVRVLDDLSRSLPDWVWLTEVSFDGLTVQIKGKALSNNLISDFIDRLEASPDLTNIELNSSTARRVQNDEFQEFTMRAGIKRKAEAVPATANPEPAAKPAVKQRGTP